MEAASPLGSLHAGAPEDRRAPRERPGRARATHRSRENRRRSRRREPRPAQATRAKEVVVALAHATRRTRGGKAALRRIETTQVRPSSLHRPPHGEHEDMFVALDVVDVMACGAHENAPNVTAFVSKALSGSRSRRDRSKGSCELLLEEVGCPVAMLAPPGVQLEYVEVRLRRRANGLSHGDERGASAGSLRRTPYDLRRPEQGSGRWRRSMPHARHRRAGLLRRRPPNRAPYPPGGQWVDRRRADHCEPWREHSFE